MFYTNIYPDKEKEFFFYQSIDHYSAVKNVGKFPGRFKYVRICRPSYYNITIEKLKTQINNTKNNNNTYHMILIWSYICMYVCNSS